MAIGYTPTTWVDNDTLVDAARLNNIETGVQAACDELDEFYDSSTKEMNAPGSVNIQELNSNINIGSSSVWIGLAAYISFLGLHSQNSAEYTVGDINDTLSNALSLINYGGDIIIQNAENSNFGHGDIRLLTDGQALYNGVEIATKAEVTSSGIDLNTLTKEGKYQTYNAVNLPSGVSGFATVEVVPFNNDTAYPRQILYPLKSHSIYVRYCNGGTWSSWDKLATKSDLPKSYSAAWTATASSSYGTHLTDSITVPSGLYLLSMRTPYSTDTTPVMIGLGGYFSANTTFIGGGDSLSMNPSQDEKTMIVRFSATSTICISSKANAQMTWDSSYLTRGGLTAIRLAD